MGLTELTNNQNHKNMKNGILIFVACMMSLVVASCGGNSNSSEADRIAQLEDSIRKIQSDKIVDGNNESKVESCSDDDSFSSSSQSKSVDSFGGDVEGTYEFSDNINTWVLVVNGDETAYIYNKAKGDGVKAYGSWYKYDSMKYAAFSFSDKAPRVFFPSGEETLRYPRINNEWIYYNSSAADAKNPEKRLPLKKIK